MDISTKLNNRAGSELLTSIPRHRTSTPPSAKKSRLPQTYPRPSIHKSLPSQLLRRRRRTKKEPMSRDSMPNYTIHSYSASSAPALSASPPPSSGPHPGYASPWYRWLRPALRTVNDIGSSVIARDGRRNWSSVNVHFYKRR